MSSSTYPIDYQNYFNKIRGEAIYNAGLSQDMKVYSEALAAIEDLIFYDQLDAMDSLDKTSYGKLLGIGGLAEQYGKSKIEFEDYDIEDFIGNYKFKYIHPVVAQANRDIDREIAKLNAQYEENWGLGIMEDVNSWIGMGSLSDIPVFDMVGDIKDWWGGL